MNRMWPFNLFPSMKDDDTSHKKELTQVDSVETELDDDVDTGEDPEVPDDETVEENLPEEEDVDDDDVVIEDDIITEEEMPNDEISDDDEEENLPDLEEELEIALCQSAPRRSRKEPCPHKGGYWSVNPRCCRLSYRLWHSFLHQEKKELIQKTRTVSTARVFVYASATISNQYPSGSWMK